MTNFFRPVRHFFDSHNRALVALPLTNRDREAILWADDFAAIRALGVSCKWFINEVAGKYAYVRCKPPGQNTTTVAKLIMQPALDQHVDHLDGDATNLRRENLVFGIGRRCTARCPFYRIATR